MAMVDERGRNKVYVETASVLAPPLMNPATFFSPVEVETWLYLKMASSVELVLRFVALPVPPVTVMVLLLRP
jgi:hypothetical protein